VAVLHEVRDPGNVGNIIRTADAAGADAVIVTDDNPRSEEPQSIRDQVKAGVNSVGVRLEEIADRRAAVRSAIEQARPGDTVLVLGKGHETGQEIAGVVHPFDDRTVVTEILADRNAE
jgi:UDP-N-acetylmuramoyl-L-alanyl-D-glutamate--2,6-diaminopimelate ligase